jgi:hypothetical protein
MIYLYRYTFINFSIVTLQVINLLREMTRAASDSYAKFCLHINGQVQVGEYIRLPWATLLSERTDNSFEMINTDIGQEV